ncbi:hypothetical protein FNV43_RR11014 [Rhamnella rubrinervis]|uniref:Uncharacterized protein n=1 Tax=Rhamnella rubrinervis TaxID=2594499 RepID=A0A8K0MHC3_9ROSA|nr:hypothetical protein FNV43_RR11014 [Rhamnella rubrinervis]
MSLSVFPANPSSAHCDLSSHKNFRPNQFNSHAISKSKDTSLLWQLFTGCLTLWLASLALLSNLCPSAVLAATSSCSQQLYVCVYCHPWLQVSQGSERATDHQVASARLAVEVAELVNHGQVWLWPLNVVSVVVVEFWSHACWFLYLMGLYSGFLRLIMFDPAWKSNNFLDAGTSVVTMIITKATGFVTSKINTQRQVKSTNGSNEQPSFTEVVASVAVPMGIQKQVSRSITLDHEKTMVCGLDAPLVFEDKPNSRNVPIVNSPFKSYVAATTPSILLAASVIMKKGNHISVTMNQRVYHNRLNLYLACGMGVPLKFDLSILHDDFGHLTRILVDADMASFLPDMLTLNVDGYCHEIFVVYENLPVLCIVYNNVGHLLANCCLFKWKSDARTTTHYETKDKPVKLVYVPTPAYQ